MRQQQYPARPGELGTQRLEVTFDIRNGRRTPARHRLPDRRHPGGWSAPPLFGSCPMVPGQGVADDMHQTRLGQQPCEALFSARKVLIGSKSRQVSGTGDARSLNGSTQQGLPCSRGISRFGIHRRHPCSPFTRSRGGSTGARPHIEDPPAHPDPGSVKETGHRIRAEFGESRSIGIGLPCPCSPLGLIKRRLHHPSLRASAAATTTRQDPDASAFLINGGKIRSKCSVSSSSSQGGTPGGELRASVCRAGQRECPLMFQTLVGRGLGSRADSAGAARSTGAGRACASPGPRAYPAKDVGWEAVEKVGHTRMS